MQYWKENAPTLTDEEWQRTLARVGTEQAPAPKSATDEGGAQNCLLWKGHVTSNGYGRINVKRPDGKKGTAFAHVLAYLNSGRVRQGGAEVRHLCGRANCVEPTHLKLGSRDENEQDKKVQARPKPPYVVTLADDSLAAVAEERKGIFMRLHDGRWIPETQIKNFSTNLE